ncbi:pyridoxamine 5'-phosphate oxidase family protein [Veillonella caviae]|uniref:pyridoxamine 5'-phosphate oxidase family protein n=1 Tax=Veillonella caviae TaxID=248316 RepID=UPI0023F789F0|nr:pyridoxamine 5'-phosphate oxidase family protein [Veillonella caviae]
MFRPVRRKANEMGSSATEALLKVSRRGVLAMQGENGYPYAIPINYFYDESTREIYFHGSRFGYKIEALGKSAKVCLTVVGEEVIKDEDWAPYVQSAVVFGTCCLMEHNDEAMARLKQFAMKYYPDEHLVDDQIARSGRPTQMFIISIDHMSGKEVQEK